MTTTTSATKPASSTTSEKPDKSDLVLIDLGKKSSKQVKRLKRSEGKLSVHVAQTLEQLKADGVVGANAQPVVFIVERKAKKKSLLAWN